jgi:hypothetical protein
MGTSGAGQAREAAVALRRVAAGLASYSVGSAWRSPAKDVCDARLQGLQEDALTVARRLELWAEGEGERSVWAESL